MGSGGWVEDLFEARYEKVQVLFIEVKEVHFG